MHKFGPFELEACLGRGGSAEVWRATRRGPHGFARTVALKRLLPERREPRLLRALLDEARLAARLEHQNVAQVLEVVEVAGEPAIVMELVDGCELRALMKALSPFGPPAPGLGAFVAHEVCRALAAAHAAEPPILHRDVSPTNVLLARSGAVKLADFGIGKVLQQGDDKTGSFKGNLGYMAPEQLARAELGPTADVYATGVLLWEMLTGKRLFVALDLSSTGEARLKPIAAPSTLNPAVPQSLDTIVARALRSAPDLRFRDGAEMAEALAPIAHQLGFGHTQLAALVCDHASPPPQSEPLRHTQTNAPAPLRHTQTNEPEPLRHTRTNEPEPLRHTQTNAATPVVPPLEASSPRGRRWTWLALVLLAGAAGASAAAWRTLPPIAAIDPPPVAARAPIVAPQPLAVELPRVPPPPPPSAPRSTPPQAHAPRRKHHAGEQPNLVGGKLIDPFHR